MKDEQKLKDAMKELLLTVTANATKARQEECSANAMHFTQSALNAANAYRTLSYA